MPPVNRKRTRPSRSDSQNSRTSADTRDSSGNDQLSDLPNPRDSPTASDGSLQTMLRIIGATTSRDDTENLCQECRLLDIVSICDPKNADTYGIGQDVAVLGLRVRDTIARDSGCELCQLFSDVKLPCKENEDEESTGYSLRAVSSFRVFPFTCKQELPKTFTALPAVLLVVVPTCRRDVRWASIDVERHGWRNGAFLSLVDPSAPDTGGFQGRLVSREAPLDLFKSWIQYCQDHHKYDQKTGQGCNWGRVPIPKGMHLIDCETLLVLPANTSFAPKLYASLSYTCGDTQDSENEYRFLTQGSPSLQNILRHARSIPATVEDAMKVTKGLGLRYLWVEQYCIDPDEQRMKSQDLRTQHSTRIHQGAEVVIIIGTGADLKYGLPGVGRLSRARQPAANVQGKCLVSTLALPNPQFTDSTWKKLAFSSNKTHKRPFENRWTRALVLLDHQAVFCCNSMTVYESFSAPLDILHTADKLRMCNFLNYPADYLKRLHPSKDSKTSFLREYEDRKEAVKKNTLNGFGRSGYRNIRDEFGNHC